MLVLFWILLKKNNNWFLSFLVTLVVSYMIRTSLTGRAQVVSYILFLIEIQLIESFIKKKSILSIIGITLISCIIANIHATAWIMVLVLFLPYIGEYIFSLYTIEEINNRNEKRAKKKLAHLKSLENNLQNEEKIKKLESEIKYYEDLKTKKDNREHKIIISKIDNEKWLFIPLIFAIIGGLITPIGSVPFTYYLKVSVGNTLTYINEHLPIVPATNLEFFAFTAILVAIIGFTNSKLKLSDAFLILGLYLMTISARRNCYLMIPLCAVPITGMINEFLNSNLDKEQTTESSKKFLNIIFCIFCIVIFFFSMYNYAIDLNKKYIDEKMYPTKAGEFIKNNLDLKEIRLYNAYHVGSYLLMKGIPVFIDSRCDLYTPEFNKGVVVFDDYMDVQYGDITIFELLEKYDMTHVVISKEEVEYVYLKDDSRAEILYEDEYFAVFKYEPKVEDV